MNSEQATLTPMRRRAVDRLLIDYLELPESEQPAWLARTRRRLPRLGSWLVQLIDDSHTVTLLDESVRRLAGQSVDRMEISVTRLVSGDRLGPWKVIEEVGQGGMGRVYRGQRADGAFEMDVAIKQIGQRRRSLAELLQRECRLLAKLDHPSVTRLVDAGLDDRAGPFLVMEWVQGNDLADWLTKNEPDLNTRLSLFEDIAEAVAHAHQRLIVHGDIKPGNVRIREDGTVKLMDFGVAMLLESGDGDPDRLRALTPAFAAPEQRAGSDITPSTDVWSLGALLLWLLSADKTSDPAATTEPDIAADAGRHRSELAAIIRQACAEQPEKRYLGAADVAEEIRRIRNNYPVHALSGGRVYRANRFVRRNPGLVGGLVLSLLVLSVGLAMTTSMYLQAEQARHLAETHQLSAESRALELEQVAGFQAAQLGHIQPAQMGAGLRVAILEQHRDAIDSIGLQPAEANELIASFELALDRLNFTDLALDSLDQNLFAQTLEAIDDQFAGQPIVRAHLLQSIASTLEALGRAESAVDPQLTALAIRREKLGNEHAATLESVYTLGSIYWRLSRLEASRELHAEALRWRMGQLGPRHPATLESLHGKGTILQALGLNEQGLDLIEQAVAGRKEVLGERHIDTLQSMSNLSVQLAMVGRLDEALEVATGALESLRETAGEQHYQFLSTLNNVGMILDQLLRYEQAAEAHALAVELRTQQFGTANPETLRARSNLAFSIQMGGDLERAESEHRETLAMRKQSLGLHHGDTWVSLVNLGENLRNQDRLEEALKFVLEAVEVGKKVYGEFHLRTLVAESNLARTLLDLGRAGEAEVISGLAAAKALEHLGQENMYTGIVLVTHGHVLLTKEDFAGAASQGELAWEVFTNTVGPDHGRTRNAASLMTDIHERWHDSSRSTEHREAAELWRGRALKSES
ncbi:MAG: tetratricopeptide repeat protein [Wenzhouxiangella sp.]